MIRAAILFIIGTALFAADVSGKWSGAVVPGNNADSVPISLELRQKGSRVIGVAITRESGVCQLLDGAIVADRVAFSIRIEKESVFFDLTISGDKLHGQVSGKRDDGSRDDSVALNLERETPANSGPFAGTWAGKAEVMDNGREKSETFTLTLLQSGAEVSGAITDPSDADHPLANVKVSGNRIVFEVDRLQASLTVSGDAMTGTGTVEQGGGEQVLQLSLWKQHSPAGSSPVSGRWAGMGEIVANGQRFPISFRLQQKDAVVSGKFIDEKGKALNISAGAIHGNKVAFDVGEQSDRVHFDLTLDGDELSGTAVETGKPNSGLQVTAVRRFD